jgi:hypothetical protein
MQVRSAARREAGNIDSDEDLKFLASGLSAAHPRATQ